MRAIMAVMMISLASVSVPARSAEKVGLAELERELLENNPRIKAARGFAAAARQEVSAVSFIDDPMFTYGYFGESIQTRVGPQKNLFQLSQKIPLGGKLSLRGEMAGLSAKASDALAEGIVWEELTGLRKAYFDLWWVDQALRITAEESELIGALEEIARSKYASGQAGQQDVLKAGLQLSRLEEQDLQLAQQRRTLTAMIGQLLDRPADAPLGEMEPPAPVRLELSLPAARRLAQENNPALKKVRWEEDRAGTGVDYARRKYVPDLTLGASYYDIGSGETTSPDDGTDAWLVSVGINIPLWFWRNRGEVRAAASRLEAVREESRTRLNTILFRVSDRYFKLTTAGEQVKLYEEALIPQARQTFEASRAGYEAGRTDFLNLLDSEQALLKVRLASLKAAADWRKSLAELEEAVGASLTNDELLMTNVE